MGLTNPHGEFGQNLNVADRLESRVGGFRPLTSELSDSPGISGFSGDFFSHMRSTTRCQADEPLDGGLQDSIQDVPLGVLVLGALRCAGCFTSTSVFPRVCACVCVYVVLISPRRCGACRPGMLRRLCQPAARQGQHGCWCSSTSSWATFLVPADQHSQR